MSKYEEVYQDLRKKILDGEYAPTSALDKEAVLCKRYGISRPTLKKAIDLLKQDGLVHSKQGSGTYVNPSEFLEPSNIDTLTERANADGQNVTSKVLCCELIPADKQQAELLHVDVGVRIIHYERVRILDGKPHALEETYMPEYLFPDFSEKALYGSMIHYIEDLCGYQISHEVKTISAAIPGKHTQKALKVNKNRALLIIGHQVFLTRNIVVQYTTETTLDDSVRITLVR